MDKDTHPRQCNCNYFFSAKIFFLLQIALIILFINGCTFLTSGKKPLLKLSDSEIENILQQVRDQQDNVSEFYFTGKLTINGWILDSSVDIHVFVKKEPFTCKMEIFHTWGKQLMSLLIKEDRLDIRNFYEEKQYTGNPTPENLAKILPNMECTPEILWAFLRGYPALEPYRRIYEKDSGVFILEGNRKKTVQKINISSEKIVEEISLFPPNFPAIRFTDFNDAENISYAEKTVMEDIKGKKDMTLKRVKIKFNRQIPDEIFTIKNTPFFEVIDLDRM